MEKNIEDRLSKMLKDFEEMSVSLTDPNVLNNIKEFTLLNKKIKGLEQKVELYKRYLDLKQEIADATTMLQEETDHEMIVDLKLILHQSKKDLKWVDEEILDLMVNKDPLDEHDAIVEIQGAAGGDEAKIFAGDLYRMYVKYAAKMEWTIEIIDSEESNQGGFAFVSFSVNGTDVYGHLKFESGVHRVQRVPLTESLGRVHTSTATVVVTPQLDDDSKEIEVLPSDLRIDTYRASGAGGQHINKTDSAVRITHIPTGTVAQSQDGRSQHDNKDKAMKTLLSKLYDQKLQEEAKEKNEIKSSIVGTGDRSEKIRTYNYPQNRITDHRVGLTLKKLDRVMDGGLAEMIDVIIATNKGENNE